MRSRGKALTLALLCVAGLVAAAVSFGAVGGERGTRIISPPGGSPSADGPSIKPSLDGQTKSGNGAVNPHCVAFQSKGQLAKGDSSDDWDIYLYDIGSKKTKLVSAGKTNARDGSIDLQSDLDSDQVKISGAGEQACFRYFGLETHDLEPRQLHRLDLRRGGQVR